MGAPWAHGRGSEATDHESLLNVFLNYLLLPDFRPSGSCAPSVFLFKISPSAFPSLPLHPHCPHVHWESSVNLNLPKTTTCLKQCLSPAGHVFIYSESFIFILFIFIKLIVVALVNMNI